MTLIGSGIHINMGQMAAGALGNGNGEELIGYSEYTPPITQGDLDVASAAWDAVPGMGSVRQTNNSITTWDSDGGAYWGDMPIPLTSNDMWIEYKIATVQSTRYMGGSVRQSAVAETYYGLWTRGTGWELKKTVAGAETVLDSGLHTLLVGEVYRLEVEGTTITAYRDDVQIAQETDAVIASGGLGVIGDGLTLDQRIVQIRGGDLPKGNLPVNNTWVNQSDNYLLTGTVLITSSCFAGDMHQLFDGVEGSIISHVVDHTPHHLEFDFGETRVMSRWRARCPSTDPGKWTDVSVLVKLEAEDDWTTVLANQSLDNLAAAGWKQTPVFDIIMPARYARVEIHTTEDGNNFAQAYEVHFYSQGQP